MKLLPNVAWNFTTKDYQTVHQFSEAVAQYQHRIMGARASWKPNDIVLETPAIEVVYECWTTCEEPLSPNEELIKAYADGAFEEREVVARFTAENGQTFTAVELLYKIHQQLKDKGLGDHTFFEGLTPAEPTQDGQVSRFYLYCGS